ncbi:MAG: ECF transporter S component [Aerococcus sp.]|nr:ECF transporter S component [Aerococcus sp.]
MQGKQTQKLITIALMGAVAFILMWFAFPVIPTAPFLKVDFSDIPVLLTTFLYGPVGGSAVIVIRGVVHYIQTGGDMGLPIGDAASVLASLAFMWPVYHILQQTYFTPNKETGHEGLHSNHFKRVFTAYGLGTLAMVVVMSVLNYFVITPFYVKVMNFPIPDMNLYILSAVIPFNFIKGVAISIASHVVLRYLLPIISKRLH